MHRKRIVRKEKKAIFLSERQKGDHVYQKKTNNMSRDSSHCMHQNVTTSLTVITRTIPSIFALDFQKEL